MTEVLLYGDPDWHDLNRCKCDRHCRNCGATLLGYWQRKYCSDYCGRRYRAEVRLDELLTSRESSS